MSAVALEAKAQVVADLRRRLRVAEGGFGDAALRRHVPTGIAPLDEALPGGGLPAGALVELLSAEGGGAWSFACIAARAAARDGGFVAWIDAAGDLYPPAAVALGLDPARLLVVRPRSAADALWAFDQAIRSRAVAAAIVALNRLSTPVTRRLQLAAEIGEGVALLLRDEREARIPSAAAVRLRVRPAPSAVLLREGASDELREGASGEGGLRRFAVEAMRARGGAGAGAVLVEIDDRSGAIAASSSLASSSPIFSENDHARGVLPRLPAAFRGPRPARRVQRSASA